ncbi:hypothetical protein MLD38_025513 [Melastoma candidum]|uniref:Uncharacterized protein n=1 Tax=Melastoma candidum TaxID=119954 RepID=A0ACB9NW25_9MYRT|nr:hypothetical protein MLD38_025513 [Melastoma candidum]
MKPLTFLATVVAWVAEEMMAAETKDGLRVHRWRRYRGWLRAPLVGVREGLSSTPQLDKDIHGAVRTIQLFPTKKYCILFRMGSERKWKAGMPTSVYHPM